jgi:hypothetical protein
MAKKKKKVDYRFEGVNTYNPEDYEFDSVSDYGEEECLPIEDIIDCDIPDYYIGKKYKYEARKVCEDFELTYNLGTAVTYLLRAYRKHSTPIDCIKKAMVHLKFELEKLENN